MANESEDDPFESAFLHAFPNPERIGCPGNQIIKKIALKQLPVSHPALEHIARCSPCFRDIRILQTERAQFNTGVPAATRTTYARTAVIGAVLAVLIAGSLLAWRNHRLSSDLNASRKQSLKHEEQTTSLEQELQSLRERDTNSQKIKPQDHNDEVSETVISVMLWPGHERGPESQLEQEQVVLPTKPSRVLLIFQFEQGSFSKYEAILKSVGGIELRRVLGLHDHQLKRMGRAVSVALPSRIFANGSYVVDLVGLDSSGARRTVEEYTFTVLHRD